MTEYTKCAPRGEVKNAVRLADELSVSPIVAELLCSRGLDDVESARAFLSPDTDGLHDPFLFEQMQDATDCIFGAMANDDLICVYGDYDVDGIMAVTILVRYLRSLGANVTHYIPSRHTEGYGLNRSAIKAIAEKGVGLFITVDCGITALAEIEYAAELGMEVVVTDHHQCLPELPECAAVIDPAVPDETYPYKSLCGAGVAFKLVQALGGLDAALSYIDCAAIATLADIVPLTGENRAIVAAGLKKINNGETLCGITAMSAVSGYGGRSIDSGAISFAIAPRINAAGRTGTAETALELFMTDDKSEAERLASELDAENKRRQTIESEIFKDAMERIRGGEADVVRDNAIVLVGDGWNHGVIGIVASRLVERYTKPVILLTAEDGVCVGSGRSVKGVHLFNSLCSMSELFVRFGGHEMAAGLTIEQKNVGEFRRRLSDYLKENVDKKALVPKAMYDAELSPAVMTLDLAEELKLLAPFGMGNPAPVFRLRDVKAQNPITIGGEGRHLKFGLSRSAAPLNCVAYSMGDRQRELASSVVDLLCTLEINDFRGERKEQAIVRYVKSALTGNAESFSKVNICKFYDAIYDIVRYNKTCESHDEIDVEIREDWADGFCSWLDESPQGAAAVVCTPDGASAFITEMHRRGVLSKLDVLFGSSKDERAYNAVLFAPDTSSIANYRRILLMEKLPAKAAKLFTDNACEAKLCAGFDTRGFVLDARVKREELIPVYGAICKLAVQKTSFLSKEAYVDEICALQKPDRRAVLLGMRVFEELGFVKFTDSTTFTAMVIKNPPKRDLMESQTYAALWE